MAVRKVGRRIATPLRAAIEQAIEHTENALKVYRSLLAEDMAEEGEDKAATLLSQWAQADMYL
jgi:hypothetical protein